MTGELGFVRDCIGSDSSPLTANPSDLDIGLERAVPNESNECDFFLVTLNIAHSAEGRRRLPPKITLSPLRLVDAGFLVRATASSVLPPRVNAGGLPNSSSNEIWD